MKKIKVGLGVFALILTLALVFTGCSNDDGPSGNARLRAGITIGGDAAPLAAASSSFAAAVAGAGEVDLGTAAIVDFAGLVPQDWASTVEVFYALGSVPTVPPESESYMLVPPSGEISFVAIPNSTVNVVVKVTAEDQKNVLFYAWKVSVGSVPAFGMTGLTIAGVTATPGFGQSIWNVGTTSVTLPDSTVVARRGAVSLPVATALATDTAVAATGNVRITGYVVQPADTTAISPGNEAWVSVTPGLDFQIPEGLPYGGTLFLRTTAVNGSGTWYYRVVITITGLPDNASPFTIGGVTATLGTGGDIPEVPGATTRRGSVTLSPSQAASPAITGLPAGSTITGYAVVPMPAGPSENWNWTTTAPASLPYNSLLMIRTTISERTWYYRIVVTLTPIDTLSIGGISATLGTGGTAVNVGAAARGAVTLSAAQAVNPAIVVNNLFGDISGYFIGTSATTAVGATAWLDDLDSTTITNGAHLFIRLDTPRVTNYYYRIVVSVPDALASMTVGGATVTLGEGAGAVNVGTGTGLRGTVTLTTAQAINPAIVANNLLGNISGYFVGTSATTTVGATAWLDDLDATTITDGAHLFIRLDIPGATPANHFYRIVVTVE